MCVFFCVFVQRPKKLVHGSKGEREDILMSSFQWKRGGDGTGLELSDTAARGTHAYTHARAGAHGVSPKPVIVPAGVTRCAPTALGFHLLIWRLCATPSLSRVSWAPSLPVIIPAALPFPHTHTHLSHSHFEHLHQLQQEKAPPPIITAPVHPGQQSLY